MDNLKNIYRAFFCAWFLFWGHELYKAITLYNYIDFFLITFFLGMIILGVFLYLRIMKRTARLILISDKIVEFTMFNDSKVKCELKDIDCICKSTRGNYIKLKYGKKILLLNSMLEVETQEEGRVKRNLKDDDFPGITRKIII